MLEVILKNLLSIQEDEEAFDSETFDAAQSAALCLSKLSVALGEEIIGPIMKFSQTQISQATWKDKYVGLLSLGAILECNNEEFFKREIGSHIEALMSLLQDPSTQVRKSSSWIFTKITTNAPSLLENEDLLQKLFDFCITGMQNDVSEVSVRQAEIIGNVAKMFPAGMETSFWSKRAEPILSALLEFSYLTTNQPLNGDYSQNAINGFASIYSILEKLPADASNLYQVYMEKFFTLLKGTLEESCPVLDKREDYQGFLSLGLQTILHGMDNDKIPFEVAQQIIDILIECFKLRGNVFDDAFILISALCAVFEKAMDEFVPKLGPFIVHSLERDSLAKSGATLISDFCTMVESQKIVDGFNDYTPMLFQMLNKDTVEREGKLAAIIAIADTITMTKEKFGTFYPRTFELFFQAALHSVSDIDQQDREYVEYMISLQNALIEAFTSIAQELSSLDDTSKQAFAQQGETLMTFLVKSSGPKYNPTEDKIREIVGLFGDLASSLPSLKNILQHKLVGDILNTAKTMTGNPETLQTAQWAEAQIRNL